VNPPVLHARAALALLVLGCGAFAALAADLLLQGPMTQADAGVSQWLYRDGGAPLTALMVAISAVHGTWPLLAASAAAALALWWRRRRAWAAALVLCVPGGMLLNHAVKHAFQRARPAFDEAAAIASYSFPSGHAAGATLWWGFMLVWLFAHRADARTRIAGAALAVAMVLLTALSRVYLGVHYLSDVLAAIGEGAAWLALCFTLLARRSRGATAAG
jgi:undecaprenyl-diphosphatase